MIKNTKLLKQGSHSFTDKKNPGLFQDFPGPMINFRSQQMLKYKEKEARGPRVGMGFLGRG